MVKQTKVVTYYRVSTKQQGESGLGLESQKKTVREFVASQQGQRLASYTEVESGKKNDRPELLKAIAHAKRSGATLVVAKLDRLARNAGFLLTLQESGLPIVCCDMPAANDMTIGIMAVVAREERKMISQRTKDALAAYKDRGHKLGAQLPQCQNLTQEARERGAKKAGVSHRQRADDAYSDLYERVMEWRHSGQTYQEIADKLNEEGHTTRRGGEWNPTQVMRVINRAEKLDAA